MKNAAGYHSRPEAPPRRDGAPLLVRFNTANSFFHRTVNTKPVIVVGSMAKAFKLLLLYYFAHSECLLSSQVYGLISTPSRSKGTINVSGR